MSRLSTRLLLSHLTVAVVGASVTLVLVRLLAPADFAYRAGVTGAAGPMGPGPGTGNAGRGQALLAAFDAAINRSLAIGLAAAVLVAAGLAWVMVRRLLRPLDRVRATTRALARGDYGTRAEVPREVELAALAIDVNSLGGAIQESERRRTRLIGEVAHEMRTPLTVIDGYVEGMIDGIFAPDPERLAALGAETRVLRRLAEDLSALSRAEEGRLELRPAPLDLTGLVADTVERLRPQFDDEGVALVLEPAPTVRVVADHDRIRQVVTNLLGNALRACSGAGRVTVRVGADAGRAVVAVEDTGQGIAPEELERIFERFYRVPDPRATRRARSGSGIGLTISRSIARAHGGEVTAASPGLGGGATFRLVLPTA
ncbi:histidine kinase [Raineyella antarctica]|uniref:histidine kinase n=1 Tax=Raineyella antarctica TaxID=1577474 RepID=A0A1G6GT97_9ACTN|nr:HAMP domain-containing sensor histidine kinase [Raineyella antarctica]SDB85208.1 histidine kinase [Raineyella antarctica]